MGDTLFGGEKSGTPVETRGATKDLARLYQGLMSGGTQGMMDFFQGQSGNAFGSMFGITPDRAGVADAVQGGLTSPADRMRGLFAAMRPFEDRQVNQAVAGTRNMFGTAGGRFSRNLQGAEAQTRGELANQFARSRQEGLLSAQAQQSNFLAQLMGLANQSAGQGLQGMGLMNQFMQPGAPVYTQGILPGLISAAGNIFAATQMGGQQPQQPGGWAPGGPGMGGAWIPTNGPGWYPNNPNQGRPGF